MRLRSPKEHAMAMEARKFFYDAIMGGTVKVERRGTDKYSRTLGRVLIDGRDIAQVMI